MPGTSADRKRGTFEGRRSTQTPKSQIGINSREYEVWLKPTAWKLPNTICRLSRLHSGLDQLGPFWGRIWMSATFAKWVSLATCNRNMYVVIRAHNHVEVASARVLRCWSSNSRRTRVSDEIHTLTVLEAVASADNIVLLADSESIQIRRKSWALLRMGYAHDRDGVIVHCRPCGRGVTDVIQGDAKVILSYIVAHWAGVVVDKGSGARRDCHGHGDRGVWALRSLVVQDKLQLGAIWRILGQGQMQDISKNRWICEAIESSQIDWAWRWWRRRVRWR